MPDPFNVGGFNLMPTYNPFGLTPNPTMGLGTNPFGMPMLGLNLTSTQGLTELRTLNLNTQAGINQLVTLLNTNSTDSFFMERCIERLSQRFQNPQQLLQFIDSLNNLNAAAKGRLLRSFLGRAGTTSYPQTQELTQYINYLIQVRFRGQSGQQLTQNVATALQNLLGGYRGNNLAPARENILAALELIPGGTINKNQIRESLSQLSTVQSNNGLFYACNSRADAQDGIGFTSREAAVSFEQAITSGNLSNINLTTSNGKIYLRISGQEEPIELNQENYNRFRNIFGNALRNKYGANSAEYRLFNSLSFNFSQGKFSIGNVVLNSTFISMNTILSLADSSFENNHLGGLIQGRSTIIRNIVSGLNSYDTARVIVALNQNCPNLQNDGSVRFARFLLNPNLSIYGYQQSNDPNADHASFNTAMQQLREDMAAYVEGGNISVGTIQELATVIQDNYGLNIRPIIEQAYQDALGSINTRYPLIANAEDPNAGEWIEMQQQAREAERNRLLSEMQQLSITPSEISFSEKLSQVWDGMTAPFGSQPTDEEYNQFFANYAQTNNLTLEPGQTAQAAYLNRIAGMLSTYSNINVTEFIRRLSTEYHIEGLEHLTAQGVTQHQVLNFVYTNHQNNQSMPVFLIGGRAANGSLLFIDPTTGRRYTGANINQIREQFLQRNNLPAYGRLSWQEGNQVRDEIVPMNTWKRTVGIVNTATLAIGTVATIASFCLPGGQLAGAAGLVAMGSFASSIALNGAMLVDRSVNGENVTYREVIEWVAQAALIGGGALATGLSRFGAQAANASRTLRGLYAVANRMEQAGQIFMQYAITRDVYLALVEEDPQAALNAIQGIMMLAAATRAQHLSSQRQITPAEQTSLGFRPGETVQNFISRMRNRGEALLSAISGNNRALPAEQLTSARALVQQHGNVEIPIAVRGNQVIVPHNNTILNVNSLSLPQRTGLHALIQSFQRGHINITEFRASLETLGIPQNIVQHPGNIQALVSRDWHSYTKAFTDRLQGSDWGVYHNHPEGSVHASQLDQLTGAGVIDLNTGRLLGSGHNPTNGLKMGAEDYYGNNRVKAVDPAMIMHGSRAGKVADAIVAWKQANPHATRADLVTNVFRICREHRMTVQELLTFVGRMDHANNLQQRFFGNDTTARNLALEFQAAHLNTSQIELGTLVNCEVRVSLGNGQFTWSSRQMLVSDFLTQFSNGQPIRLRRAS